MLPLRNRGLDPNTVTVLPIPFARPDHTGHKEYDFTPNSPAAKRAEKIFNRLMDKGYLGGKRMADGELKEDP